MNSTVPAILDELEVAGVPVVLAADVEAGTIRSGVHLVRGDPTTERTISLTNPAGAQQALITGMTDGDVLVSAVILHKLAPDLPITALVTSASVREALRDLGVQHAVSADELVAARLPPPWRPRTRARWSRSSWSRAGTSWPRSTPIRPRSAKPSAPSAASAPGWCSAWCTFTLGIGEDPVIAAGDRLLIAEPSTSRSRRGVSSR
jgi:TrkA-N domain